jgi:hypothetical protein
MQIETLVYKGRAKTQYFTAGSQIVFHDKLSYEFKPIKLCKSGFTPTSELNKLTPSE